MLTLYMLVQLAYSITGGEGTSLFAIDSNSGQISTAAAPAVTAATFDYETKTCYTLVVSTILILEVQLLLFIVYTI